jgi:hypothetical protein
MSDAKKGRNMGILPTAEEDKQFKMMLKKGFPAGMQRNLDYHKNMDQPKRKPA